MNVLLVKITSMGDIIHALPAITDAAKHFPEIRFDWVVDRNFAEIPLWHPHVSQVIPSAHRYWRKNIYKSLIKMELYYFWKQLRAKKYDFIIDGQSSIKSAVISRCAKGIRHGLDAESVREPGAYLAYQKKYFVPKPLHAVDRLRKLFSLIFDYQLPESQPDFGLEPSQFSKPSMQLPSNFFVFIPNTSWKSKYYSEDSWAKLIKLVAPQHPILLPWGSINEAQLVQSLEKIHPNVTALPKLSLSEIAYIISKTSGVVSVDTGLGHLAAALNIPNVNLYGPTDPKLIGATGENQIHLQPAFPCLKCYKKTCSYQGELRQNSECMMHISPVTIWEQLQKLLY